MDYLGLTHPFLLSQAILESGTELCKGLSRLDMKLDLRLQSVGRP